MNMNGKKLDKQPTNSQRIREIDTELQNLQVASRISQMMIQNLLKNMQTLSQDLGKAYGIVNDLQYMVMAMKSVGHFDEVQISAEAEKIRLKDFESASDAEDVKGGFTVGDVVKEDSTVILTSTTSSPNGGIFRSRIALAESGVPALIQGLLGKSVGAEVVCKLNDEEHRITLLGIRNLPPAAKVEVESAPESITLPANSMVH